MRRGRKPFSKMQGLTLLETMFAIAVGALVLIGAIIFYMSTKQSANANKAVGDMNAIVAAYQNYIAAGQTLSEDTDIPALQKLNYLPTPLTNPWGQSYDDTGAVTVSATGGATYIVITIEGIGGTGDNNCTAIVNLAGASSSTSGNPPVQNATTSATACEIKYIL